MSRGSLISIATVCVVLTLPRPAHAQELELETRAGILFPSNQEPSLAPFGAGNPSPLFTASSVEVIDGPRRIKDRHLKMAFRQDGKVLRGMAWRAVEREAFVTEHGLEQVPQVADPDGEIWQSLGIAAQPAWAFVDGETGQVERVLGALTPSDLQARIDALAE